MTREQQERAQLALQLYQGPLRPTLNVMQSRAHCQNCQASIAKGQDFCLGCLDPEHRLASLEAAQQAALQAFLEAHPVCARCGRALSPSQVAGGQTRHDKGYDFYGCAMPHGWEEA